MKNVLVTGGGGFIGSNLIKFLSEDCFCASIDKKTGLNLLRGDLDFYFSHGFDSVVHLAACASVNVCERDKKLAYLDNYLALERTLQLAKKKNIQHFIFASSAAVYGDTDTPHKESESLDPANFYGYTKLMGEHLVRAYYPKATIFRFFNVYGEGANPAYGSVIYNFLQSCLNGESLEICGEGKQSRDFIFVNDICRAIQIAIHTRLSGTFNLGTGVKTSILELAKIFSDLNPEIKEEFLVDNPGVLCSNADISKITKYTGWTPQAILKDEITALVQKEKEKLTKDKDDSPLY